MPPKPSLVAPTVSWIRQESARVRLLSQGVSVDHVSFDAALLLIILKESPYRGILDGPVSVSVDLERATFWGVLLRVRARGGRGRGRGESSAASGRACLHVWSWTKTG